MSDIDIAIISDYHFLKHGISCVNRIRIPSENVEKHINLIEAIVFLMEILQQIKCYLFCHLVKNGKMQLMNWKGIKYLKAARFILIISKS